MLMAAITARSTGSDPLDVPCPVEKFTIPPEGFRAGASKEVT